MRILLDENFDNDLLRGLLIRIPNLDYVRVQDVMEGADNPRVLEWAAQEGRILFARDVKTMMAFAYERVNQALPMPGVIEVSDQYSKGFLIEELFDFIMLC